MIISHKYKFIFIKTRKTAGTSIALGLSKYCGPDDVLPPMRESEELKREAGHPGAKNYEIPFRRLGMRDWMKLPLRGRPEFRAHSPAEFVRDHLPSHVWNSYFKFSFERNPFDRALSQFYWNTREGGSFEGMSMADHYAKAESYRKSNWEMYTIDGKIVVDQMFHYETLQADMAKLQDILGLPEPVSLPRAKTQHRSKEKADFRSLSDELRAKVRDSCRREIEQFGYSSEELLPTRPGL